MDDVILAHKLRQLNVAAQLEEAQPTCSLGLGYRRPSPVNSTVIGKIPLDVDVLRIRFFKT